MLKIFSLFAKMFSKNDRAENEGADWICDLLHHPDIARMDGRELGDLPFPVRPVRKVRDTICTRTP